MQKRGYILIAVFSSLLFLSLIAKSSAMPLPPIPTGCSTPNITAVWDFIFQESSTGITILTNTSDPKKCTSFVAYKKNYVTNDLYTLVGYEINYTAANESIFIAARRNYTGDNEGGLNISTIKSIANQDNYHLANCDYYTPNNRSNSLSTTTSAESVFRSTFKIPSSTWSVYIFPTKTEYRFSLSESSTLNTNFHNAFVDGNESCETNSYNIKKINTPSPECIQNWSAVNQNCFVGDIRLTWYNDTNRCNNETGRPLNQTFDCDYDNNGVIGNVSRIMQINLNTQMYIGSAPYGDNITYNTSRRIEFKSNNQNILEFSYDFNDPLNVKNVTLMKQNSSFGYGYLIVHGLKEITKTFLIDRLIPNSTRVCILDREFVYSINDFSVNCTNNNERILNCTSSMINGYNCTMFSNYFLVYGPSNSGVKELPPLITIPQCTSNWNCSTIWTLCNGTKSRRCNDIALCNSTIRIDTEECTPPVICISNWSNCSAWSPAKCKSGSNQTRLCSDSAKCINNKKSEVRECENPSKPKKTLIIIIVIILSVIIIVTITVIVLILNKKEPIEPLLVISQQNQSDNPPSNQNMQI